MDKPDIAALADRIEQAEATEQRGLIEEAAIALKGHSQAKIDPWWDRFDRLFDADAQEDAWFEARHRP